MASSIVLALRRLKKPSIIPGFGLTLLFTLFYLALIVVIPLSGLFVKTATLNWAGFWAAVTSERVMHAYKISFGIALADLLAGDFPEHRAGPADRLCDGVRARAGRIRLGDFHRRQYPQHLGNRAAHHRHQARTI